MESQYKYTANGYQCYIYQNYQQKFNIPVLRNIYLEYYTWNTLTTCFGAWKMIHLELFQNSLSACNRTVIPSSVLP